MAKEIDDAIEAIKAKVKKEVKEVRTDGKDGKKIKKATGAKWRLVHDGSRVIALFEGSTTDCTTTKHEIFIGTREECEAEVSRLGLKEGYHAV